MVPALGEVRLVRRDPGAGTGSTAFLRFEVHVVTYHHADLLPRLRTDWDRSLRRRSEEELRAEKRLGRRAAGNAVFVPASPLELSCLRPFPVPRPRPAPRQPGLTPRPAGEGAPPLPRSPPLASQAARVIITF